MVELFTQISTVLFHTQLASAIVIHPNSKLVIKVNASDSQKRVFTPT